jgi:hypothetical protein
MYPSMSRKHNEITNALCSVPFPVRASFPRLRKTIAFNEIGLNLV